jgi:hypothetical protein
MAADVQVLRPGDTATPTPYTVCIIANPALEAPWRSGQFVPDPIAKNPAAFSAAVRYILDALFGMLPGQMEPALSDAAIGPHVRVLSIFDPGLPATDANALVGQDPVSTIAVPRRQQCAAFALRHVALADVVYAVTASPSHQRASAFFTSDDDTREGEAFDLDGRQLHHRYYPAIPGTIALPVTSTSLTALHEFQHAASSYTNGSIGDLYIDNGPVLRRVPPPLLVNAKAGRPIPGGFATYCGSAYGSDPDRDHIGYPASWTSYHCALHDPARPAVMDDYWQTTAPIACLNDRITRAFLRDRILAKVGRPPLGGPLVAAATAPDGEGE